MHLGLGDGDVIQGHQMTDTTITKNNVIITETTDTGASWRITKKHRTNRAQHGRHTQIPRIWVCCLYRGVIKFIGVNSHIIYNTRESIARKFVGLILGATDGCAQA